MIVALIPAAGLSQRMGRPKPLLDLGDGPMIARVVRALKVGGSCRIVVVVPPAYRYESARIAAEAEAAGAEVVVPDHQPADMRASIESGLLRFEDGPRPFAFLLAPADMPGISAELVRLVIDASRADPSAIVVPRSSTKRGHPALLPWSIALEIRNLPEGSGVKALFDRPFQKLIEVPVSDPSSFVDLDTPAEFQQWTGRPLP